MGRGQWIGWLVLLLAACGSPPAATSPVLPSPTLTPGPTVTPLPGQAIPNPPTLAPTAPGVALPGQTPGTPDPAATSLFDMPTDAPAPPAYDVACAQAFPPETALRILADGWTITQVEAAFGPVLSVSGRPPVYRFEAGDCVLTVTAGVSTIQQVTLMPYFTLGELLDRYRDPAATADVPGSVRLPVGPGLVGPDRFALLYPAAGVAALFDGPPASRQTRIAELRLLPVNDLDGLLAALGPEVALTEGWSLPVPLRTMP